MFDSVHIPFTCPYCGQKSRMEFQTKDLDSACRALKVGDAIDEDCDDLTSLSVIGACHSPQCQARADKASIVFQGTPSGFGALFKARITVKDGIITDEVTGVKIDPDYTEKEIEKQRDKWESKYKPRLDDWSIEYWNKVRCS